MFASKKMIKKRMRRSAFGATIGLIFGGPAGAAIGGVGGALLDRILGEDDDGFDTKRRKLKLDELAKLFERHGSRCKECGATSNLSVDHIIPLSKGGSNDSCNLRILCRRCNSRKGNRK